MVTHEIRIRIALTSRRVRWGLVLFLCLALPRIAGTDDAPSTGMMFFPSPTASYANLTSTDETRLAVYGGTVQFGNAATGTNATVFAGQAPAGNYRLRVTGFLRVDGCIWLNNHNALKGSQDNYRCRWDP
jgi:hypothetical protein